MAAIEAVRRQAQRPAVAMLTGKAAEINITAMIGIARDAWPDLKVGFIIAKIDGDS